MLDRIQAWLATVEDEFWAAHTTVLEATGAGELVEAATAASSSFNANEVLSGAVAEVRRFVHAVDWSEPLFSYVGVFHVVVWVSAIAATWGGVSDERIMAVCAVVGALLLSGVPANSVAGRHAEWLFREPGVNYFTEDGIVMMVVYLLPLLVLLVCLQMRLGYRVLSLMRQAKRAQLRHQMRKAAQAQEDRGGDGVAESKKTQ